MEKMASRADVSKHHTLDTYFQSHLNHGDAPEVQVEPSEDLIPIFSHLAGDEVMEASENLGLKIV